MSFLRRRCDYRTFHPKLSDLLGADLVTTARTLPSRSNGEARLLNVDARCNARACPHICVPGPNRIHRVHISLASRGRDSKRETKKRRCLGRNKAVVVRALFPLFFCLPVPGCLTARPPSAGAWVARRQRVEKGERWVLHKHCCCGYQGSKVGGLGDHALVPCLAAAAFIAIHMRSQHSL